MKTSNTKSYLFDIKLFSSIRVDAENEKEARTRLSELLDCCDVNFGNIEGEPIEGEASMEGEAELVEIDGEFQEGY